MSHSVNTSSTKGPAIVTGTEFTPGVKTAQNWSIRMNGLGKRYRRGGVRLLNDNFREDLMNGLARMFRGVASEQARERVENSFWALKDIDLEIHRGETVGIIGYNGAGKSTMLKILSRITAPTEGTLRYRGRLASLLEVGTGFHRELTGRENVFLNGAILGMRRSETLRAFDAIVDFAGVADFIDTPVKFYSSGMYVRLAFAVAAHLQADIIVVDEVLAVGDAQFQKKCLGKMSEIAGQGRTVLFVSHNMAAIQSLCSRCVVLKQGRIQFQGPTPEAVRTYLESGAGAAVHELGERQERQGNGAIRIQRLKITSASGNPIVRCTDPLRFELEYEALNDIENLQLQIGIYDQTGARVHFLDSLIAGGIGDRIARSGRILCETEPARLVPGGFFVNIAARVSGEMADYLQRAGEFAVEPEDFFGTGKMLDPSAATGLIRQSWSVQNR